MQFKVSKEFIAEVERLIESRNDAQLEVVLNELHFADLAEILDELDFEDATYAFKILDSEKSSEVLLELDDHLREQILSALSPKEIAEELDELDTNDAADIIAELPASMKEEVISELEDVEHAKDIVDLLRYNESTAGGIMHKELVKVNENWNVLTCVKEMRIQAEHVSRVHSIYVVDEENRLKGRLSLKDLLTTSTKTPISEVYIRKLNFVRVDEPNTEVALIMQKYDLEAIPVVDELGRLVGRITIDDIVDVIKEEADKDYQLAAGISNDVETGDSVLELTKARLPWLLMGMFIEFFATLILESNEEAFHTYKSLIIFLPLVSATAGNIGAQASALVVQGLANGTFTSFSQAYLGKELRVATISGVIIASVVFAFHTLLFGEPMAGLAIGASLIVVLTFAGTFGTLIPMMLNRYKVDPALATGPFITTTNDVFGIMLYFGIARLILGM